MSNNTEDRLSTALNGIVADRPYTPDLDLIESRGRTLRNRRVAWRATAGGSFAVAAIAAVAVATSGTGTPAPPADLAAPKPVTSSSTAAEGTPLLQLVGYLTTAEAPAGDATLVLRDQVMTDGTKIDVWDLHADNGNYYFAKTRGALPAQVTGKKLQADEAGRRKAVAAARNAAKGDLNKARKQMALAYMPANPVIKPTLLAPGVTPSLPPESKKKLKPGQKAGNTTDNWVWNNSIDALRDGAGSPAVRAGVLRLLGQMPEVTVKKTTLKGQPVLTLAAGDLATGNGTETLTVNAGTGLPIKFASNGVTINYTVTRVTIAGVAKGQF